MEGPRLLGIQGDTLFLRHIMNAEEVENYFTNSTLTGGQVNRIKLALQEEGFRVVRSDSSHNIGHDGNQSGSDYYVIMQEVFRY